MIERRTALLGFKILWLIVVTSRFVTAEINVELRCDTPAASLISVRMLVMYIGDRLRDKAVDLKAGPRPEAS